MKLGLMDEQEQILKMVNDISSEKFAPNVRSLEEEGAFPSENFSLLASQGLMGLIIPPPFGGAGADIKTFMLITEAIAKACPATAFLYTTHIAVSLGILAMGTDEQKLKYLKAISSGDVICALAGTEDGGGTNPMTIKTTAKEDGEGYIINGSKVYISGAGQADLYCVLAKTSDMPGPNSLTMFLIDKDTPGLSFGNLENKMGLQSLPTGDIIFDNVRVGKEQVLGAVGSALQVFGAVAGVAALGAGSIAVGLADAAVERTKTYILERTVMGQKLAEIAPVQMKFADMIIEANAAKTLLYQAAYDRENSPPGPIPTILQAKINATEKVLKVIDQGIQLHGAYGYSKDFPLEKYYRDARALTIHFGTNDVLRQQMSKLVLGIM